MSTHRAAMYKMELVEEIRRQLKALPEPVKDQVSKIELVRELAGEIAEQQKRGHSTERIATLMATAGVAFTSATLKTYLSKTKSQTRKPRRKRWRDPIELVASTRENDTFAPDEEATGSAQPSDAKEGDRNKNPGSDLRAAERGRVTEDAVATEEAPALTPTSQRKLQATSHETGSFAKAPVDAAEGTGSTRRLLGPETFSVEKTLQPDAQKETARLAGPASDAAAEREPPVARRLTTAEIDRNRSTFVAREDSRDI